MSVMELTESSIAYALYIHFMCYKNHVMAGKNVYVDPNFESDFVSFTRAGLANEVEIKLSRSDFLADAKKYRTKREHWGAKAEKVFKHDMLKEGTHFANYFSFAVPEGMVTAEEVPEQFGLIYLSTNHLSHIPGREIIREPKRLHKNKLPEADKNRVLQAAMYRMWKSEGKLVGHDFTAKTGNISIHEV